MTLNLTIGIPQAVLLGLYGLSLASCIAQHGEPREPLNAWTSFVALVIQLAILAWGGFFS